MTQYRKDKDAISNYFDRLEEGIGKRGSSFTDLDGVSHDGDTDRFLVREFKHPSEQVPRGQARLLFALSRLKRVTVWAIQKREDGKLNWFHVGHGTGVIIITEEQYRELVRSWWYQDRDYGDVIFPEQND